MVKEMKTPKRPSDDDARLIRQYMAGERKAFDELVLKHKDRIVNLCFWFLGDYQEANDAAQEIFIKVYRSLETFRFESAFSTWLYRIAVNTCKNKVNSLGWRFRKMMKRLDNPGGSKERNPSRDLVDHSPSPAAQLADKEKSIRIRKAVDSLPNGKKEVVVLRHVEELSYEEIAAITGVSLGTVKSRLARARNDLRKKLQRKWE